MPRKETNTGPISAQAQQDLVSEGIDNFELPKALVTKIAKSAVPENTKLQKETVLSLVKGSTVFINYLTATAHDVAQSKQHKSISASDVLKALEMIEFGDLVDKLQAELQVYRELAKTDKSKKGTSNITSSSTGHIKIRPGPGQSVSAPPAKGKGKEKMPLGHVSLPPFTSAPLPHLDDQVGESISMGSRTPMDDWEEGLGENGAGADAEDDVMRKDIEGEGEGEGKGDVPEDEDDDIGDEEDEEGEGVVLEDPMEVESEELKSGARGLEDPAPPVGYDDD